MAGLPPLDITNKELAAALKQLTAAKYGRSKAVVEKEILERISVAPSASTTATAGVGAQHSRPAKPSTGSSFLDDWMQKKQSNSFKAPTSPFKSPNQPQKEVTQNTDSMQATNTVKQPQQNLPQQAVLEPQQINTTNKQEVVSNIAPSVTENVDQSFVATDTQKPTQQSLYKPENTENTNEAQVISAAPKESSPEPSKDNSIVDLNNPHINDHTVKLR
jgi:hypothetical protein